MMNRIAKRALVIVGLGLVALGGCRAVLGIEDQDVIADGGLPGLDARADAVAEGGADAAVDATTDTGPSIAACAAQGMNCRKCCREEYAGMTGFMVLDMVSADAGCLCGACPDCNPGSCSSPPTATANPMGCNLCLDGLFVSSVMSNTPACMAAKTECRKNADCGKAVDCLAACEGK